MNHVYLFSIQREGLPSRKVRTLTRTSAPNAQNATPTKNSERPTSMRHLAPQLEQITGRHLCESKNWPNGTDLEAHTGQVRFMRSNARVERPAATASRPRTAQTREGAGRAPE